MSPPRLFGRFHVLLLDMHGTFMFGQDRFGPGEDFHATYRRLGGSRLSPGEVEGAIRGVHAELSRAYDDPARYDDFPSVAEGLRAWAGHPGLAAAEVELLVDVLAEHERGRVPADHHALLLRLARSFELGVVSNLWAPKDRWLAELARTGLLPAFKKLVFSSDGRSMKPSPVLFREALAAFDVDPGEVLFVGDSPRYDLAGAKGVGLATAWINPEARTRAISHPLADFVFPDLLTLEEAGAKP